MRSNFWNADGCGMPQPRLAFVGTIPKVKSSTLFLQSLLLAIPTDLRRQLDKKFLHSAVTLIDGLIGVSFSLQGSTSPCVEPSWWRRESAQSPWSRSEVVG
jgi:hypothetical protein